MKSSLSQLVIRRAKQCCEYCLLHDSSTVLPFHIDHIIAQQHGGATIETNLAYACANCNHHKGTNIATLDPDIVSTHPIWLFNPRKDVWDAHFILEGTMIAGLTSSGRGTAFLLQFNGELPRERRAALIEEGLYPPPHFDR